MDKLLKNYKVWLFFIVVTIAFLALAITGLNFGIDFKGGTLFQVQLSDSIDDQSQMERIRAVIEQRVNVTGLKDISVFSLSNQFIAVETPETDPIEIERIESLLRKQGRFEVRIDGDAIFSGAEVVNVDQQSSIPSFSGQGGGLIGWSLPFTLNINGATSFRDKTFHKCIPLTANQNPSSADFECEYTYFFIDRPLSSLFVMSNDDFSEDRDLFLSGNPLQNVPGSTNISAVLENIGGVVKTVDKQLDSNAILSILSTLKNEKVVLIPNSFNQKGIDALETALTAKGVRLKIVSKADNIPWIWKAAGLRSIVRLQPSITGNLPFVNSPDLAPLITNLIITGTAGDTELAQLERSETKVILQSGSLPVSVEDISKESISPALGESFQNQVLIIGLLVVLVVSIVIFIRYRVPGLSIAIVFVALSEAFVTLSFSSLFGTIDLAAMTGIIAIVGTGVDSQIVITDELLSRKKREIAVSILARFKKAFFIIAASATTLFATMLPLVLYGSVLIKLRGFAIAVMVGVMVGVLITRPAYGEIAKLIVENNEKANEQKQKPEQQVRNHDKKKKKKK